MSSVPLSVCNFFLLCLQLFVFKFVIVSYFVYHVVAATVPQLISPLLLSLFVTRTSCFPTLADTQFSHNCSSLFYEDQLIKLSTRSSYKKSLYPSLYPKPCDYLFVTLFLFFLTVWFQLSSWFLCQVPLTLFVSSLSWSSVLCSTAKSPWASPVPSHCSRMHSTDIPDICHFFYTCKIFGK